MARKKRTQRKKTPKKQSSSNHIALRILKFFVAPGILIALFSTLYQYLTGGVSLEYIQAYERKYDFELKNQTPINWIIESFRFQPLVNQTILYKTTAPAYLKKGIDGQPIMPETFVPAAGFSELDGRVLQSNDTLKFRAPPLSNISYMQPSATVIDIDYKLRPSNKIIRLSEQILVYLGLHSDHTTIRYLVVDNYWSVTTSTSPEEAIRIYCRDNLDQQSKSICSKHI
jgi:hypothetical protein